MTAADDELEALLDRIPVLQGLPRTVVELPGGLTNQSLRVTTRERDLVVRRFRGDAALLGIDRDAEHVNTIAAAEAGVGAPVVDYRPDLGVLIILAIWWNVSAKKWFTGPKHTIDETVLEAFDD